MQKCKIVDFRVRRSIGQEGHARQIISKLNLIRMSSGSWFSFLYVKGSRNSKISYEACCDVSRFYFHLKLLHVPIRDFTSCFLHIVDISTDVFSRKYPFILWRKISPKEYFLLMSMKKQVSKRKFTVLFELTGVAPCEPAGHPWEKGEMNKIQKNDTIQ